jgi:DNA-binding NarL/FixJ family response regulator
MDILLIENDDHRRVAVARHLRHDCHRVTIASSVGEAEEILRFVEHEAAAPKAVVIAESLLRGSGRQLREELAARFPGVNLIPLRADLELDWLSGWLENLAVRESKVARRKGAKRLDVVLIEADEALRAALRQNLVLNGDCVHACNSLREASAVLDEFAACGKGPHVIVSQVAAPDGDVIGFFLNARGRFPNLRWVVTPPPPSRTTSYSRALARSALGGLDQ